MTTTKRKVMLGVLGAAALLALAIAGVRGLRSGGPVSAGGAASDTSDTRGRAGGRPGAGDTDPTFATAAQALTYYGAVVEGERRALTVVEASLEQARTIGAERAHIAKLEGLRAEYQARLGRHQAKLTAARAGNP